MGKFIQYFPILLFIACILGCDAPEPAPEMKDKLVLALKYEIDLTRKKISKQKSVIIRATKILEKTDPHYIDYPLMREELAAHHNKVDELEQKLRYLEIRLQKRVAKVRRRSLASWKTGREPNITGELENFLIKMETAGKSLNWSEKVPEMYDPTLDLKKELAAQRKKKVEDRNQAIGLGSGPESDE